jgi:DNA-directed RNA polymerase subunit RPC12/RpoP
MIAFYKPPILTVIFRFLGVLALLASIVVAIITLREGAAAKDAPDAGAFVWSALGAFAAGVLVLLFYWGIAQAIDFLGKTAFYTEQMYVQNSTRAGVKGKAGRAPVTSDSYDEEDDEPEAEADPPTREKSKETTPEPAPSVERTKFACKACGQRISAMTSEIGNHIACPNCGEDVTVS